MAIFMVRSRRSLLIRCGICRYVLLCRNGRDLDGSQSAREQRDSKNANEEGNKRFKDDLRLKFDILIVSGRK